MNGWIQSYYQFTPTTIILPFMKSTFRNPQITHSANKHATIDNTQHTESQSASPFPPPPRAASPRPSISLASTHAPPSHFPSRASTKTTWQSRIAPTSSLSTSFTHFTGTKPISTRSSFITSISTLHLSAIAHVTPLLLASAGPILRDAASFPRHVLIIIDSFRSHLLQNPP